MALQKQLAHINITGNVERKDDGFLVIPSKLTRADDVVWDDASTPIVRGGQSALSLTPVGSWNLAAFTVGEARRMFTHQGVAHIEHSKGIAKVSKGGGTAPIYNENSPSGFLQPWEFIRAGMTTRRIVGVDQKGTPYGTGVPYYDGNYDCASSGDWTCYVVETRDTVGSGRQTVRLVLQNDVTGFRTYDSLLSDSTNILIKPRVVAVGSKFYIYFASFASGATAYDIKSVTLTTSGTLTAVASVATSIPTNGTAASNVNGHVLFDVAVSGAGGIGVAYLSYPSPNYLVEFADVDPTDGSTVLDSSFITPSSRPVSLTALYAQDEASDYSIHAFYGTASTSTTLKAAKFNVTAASTTAETVVGTGAGSTTVGRIAAYATAADSIKVAYDSISIVGSTQSSTLRASSFKHDYTSLTEVAGTSPWFIAGQLVSYNSRLYLPMFFYSSYSQATTYLVDFSSVLNNLGVAGSTGTPYHVVARIDYGEGAIGLYRWFSHNRVPGAPLRASTAAIPYLKYETDLKLVGTKNDTPFGLSCAYVDFASQLGHVEVNGLTMLAGACPLVYDGNSLVEEGFHHAPEVVGAGTLSGSGTYGLPDISGTYTICFTWAWQDSQGNWHESGPSNEITQTVTSGSGNYYFTPSILSPPTQKQNARLLMYRSLASSTDTTLYLASQADGTCVSQGSTGEQANSGEALYTTGDILPNEPMPACRHLSLYQGRVVASGTGDGSGVAWSKETERGYGVEFCSSDPLHRLRVPSSLGRAVGAQEVDDRLFILCERGVGIIYGTGPSATGLAGGYSDFNTIITETGCDWDSPKSIARAPEGIWFRSPFGIRLISRAGGLARGQDGKQVGAEMDEYVGGKCTAVFGDAKQQIRFYQADPGNALVWDYQWQRWSRFTNHANVDAVFADDRYYHVNNVSSVAQLRYYDETVIRDVNNFGQTGQGFAGTIETAWLQFAGIQGFQRIYRLMVLGKNTNTQPVTLVGSFFYDFSSTADSDVMIASPVTPTASGVVQVQHHMVRQKCEALKIRIEMAANATVPATSGRFRLTDLTLQVGVKPGYYKLPSSQRY